MIGKASSQLSHVVLLLLLLLGTLLYHTESILPSQKISIIGCRRKMRRVGSSRSPPSPHYSPPPPKKLYAPPPSMPHTPSLASQMPYESPSPPPPVLLSPKN